MPIFAVQNRLDLPYEVTAMNYHSLPGLRRSTRAATLLLGGLMLGACGAKPATHADQMNQSYERALARTAAAAVAYPGVDARTSLVRAEDFFDDMNAATVREKAVATYAPGAYLNDNFAVVEGAEAIGDYFLRSVQRTNSLDVEFLDVATHGIDFFVRWRMTVVSDRINDGAPLVSYGMTHFRLDDSGRVLLHKDFWDAGTGFYEYLPVFGPVLRRLRGLTEGDAT
jgi:predicted SnoaL-like aldol condensation-catalyzing enzyme